MGGLFSKPKAPPPDPAQEERIARQEEKAEADERSTRRRMQARLRSRQTGAYGMMAPGVFGSDSPERQTPLNTTLGAGRNPRG